MKVTQDNPDFKRNAGFGRDITNVAVGMVWHTMLAATPIYLVLRNMKAFGICALILAATSIFLKKNWYDKLQEI